MYKVMTSVIGGVAVILAMTTHAGGAGLPDILGIQLGMPARDAHAKLQAQIPKNQIQVTSTNLPTIEKPVITTFRSAPAQQIMMGMEGDLVTVDVTLPPNKQAVWRVNREHFFPDKGIPKKTLLASLREKYGKESRAMGQSGRATTDDDQVVSLLWLMDEQGRPSTLPPSSGGGVDPLSSCTSIVDGGNSALIVESPPPTTFASADYKWCLSFFTAVTVHFIQNASVPELYERMIVMVVSLPMGTRAGEATKKWKQDIAEGQHKQELEKAKQQEKPKL